MIPASVSIKKPHYLGASFRLLLVLPGVSNASVGQCLLLMTRVITTCRYVGLTSVRQGLLQLLRSLLRDFLEMVSLVGEGDVRRLGRDLGLVGVTSVEKGCHGLFLEEIQVPVPWLGVSAPCWSKVNVS